MTIALRRMSLDDVDRVAFIHRTSFDERLPWLAGRYTPAEDRRFFKDRVFASCEVWAQSTESRSASSPFGPAGSINSTLCPTASDRASAARCLTSPKLR